MADFKQPMIADPSQHRQELTERQNSLRRNESFCDVEILVKGQYLKAHKLVLAAASPFFFSAIESDTRERNEQLIRIELEEATASVMGDVLEYVYTGDVPVTEESCHNLIATADYLLLPGLKAVACDFVKNALTTENCLFNFCFADKYQCTELKAVCCDLVNTHFSVVMENDDFFNLDAKQVKDWVSSDDVIVNAEEEIFKGILNWVSYNKSEREQYFPELLHQVRLTSMSRDFLLKELVNEELIATNNECLKFVLGSMEYILDATGESCAKLPRKCLQKYADAIFVCGGMKALCYLPEQNKWYQLSDALFEHENHAVVQYREKIFVFDFEEVGPQEKYVLEYFVPGANLWGAIECKNFSDCGSFSSLSVVNGNVYAVTKIPEDEVSTVLRCWPDKDYYKPTEDPPTIRWGASGVSDGSHLYLVGGTSSDESQHRGSKIVERLDPSKNSWEEVAPMNEARHDAFGAALNGKIYVAGGLQLQQNRRSCKVLESCEVYNPITNEWELISSLNVTRCCADMVAFRGVLYVLGGYKDAILYKTELTVEMLNPETSEWESTSVIPCESEEETNNYRACFATVHKNVLQNKL